MKLWLIRPREDLQDSDNPWDPWYDKTFGFVIRAETEERARAIADENHGFGAFDGDNRERAWLSPEYSTCEELTADGEEGIVIEDQKWA